MMKQASMDYAMHRGLPEWACVAREEALALADQLPLPVIDRVRYNKWPIEEVAYDISSIEHWPTNPIVDKENSMARIVQIGNETILESVHVDWLEKGVIVMDLWEAMQTHPDLVQKHLMKQVVKSDEDKLVALHLGHMMSGIFVYVPRHVVLDSPIELELIANNTRSESLYKHILVVMEEGSSADLIENWTSYGTVKNTANIIVELHVKDQARLNYSTLDYLGSEMTTYLNRRARVERDATINWAIGAMSEGHLIGDFNADLVGQGASSYVNIVAIANGRQVKGIDTRVTNIAPHSIGHIMQHGVILDRATLTFNGIGHILKQAKHADAQQESRILMLSDQARGDANPILLIDEFEVTAGHAASVGKIDEEQLYYLQSRGIDESVAKKLVIRGFLGSVISMIPAGEVRSHFIELIDRKLYNGK
ncbi:Fe-S cluster assembly protein SufD [Atopobacter phocae]|uniref:Fe-S cluster assembly protein SufD n=1 Tax=Atopobacter phocae TaxID=136492 RepID=UPI0004B6673F|nr:Fe-S cluster assembly protein SufD [Atopobacter phocae]